VHKAAIGYALGRLYQVLGLVLLVPLGIAWYDYYPMAFSELTSRPEVIGFIISVILTLAIGTVLVLTLRRSRELGRINEGYAIVGLGWLSMTLFSCLPFFFYLAAQYGVGAGNLARAFTDAYFEIMSGYTTTGATILSDVEAIPRSLLFLRSVSHWLGGMGIITLAIAIFPSIGVSAYAMFRGEVPGPSKDKLLPRLAQTASILWGVYVLLTGVEAALLWFGGMNLFDAVCHAFATMATGGFSTKGASIAAYNSDFIHWVVTVFMFLAGVNFVLHFQALRGEVKAITNNSEFRFYASVVAGAIVIATLVLYFAGLDPPSEMAESFRFKPSTIADFDTHYAAEAARISSLYGSFREAAFQVVSMVTTTGFCTADFSLWPDFLRFMLVLLMFFGGCSSSTGGGIKMVRIMLISRVAWTQLRRLSQPRLVAPVKLGGQVVDDNQIINVVAFFILFTGLFVITSLLMTLYVPDLITAVTASIATLGNIGPGLAGVGATQNYGWIPLPGKWILVLSMLLGRLEIFTVLIILRPSVWWR
jgi:trk system potassium uptake protein TrkH